MKFFYFSLLLLSFNTLAQSTYSSANQDTQNNDQGTHLDTGYSNNDVEKSRVDFSGEKKSSSSKHQTLQEQEADLYPEEKKEDP